MIVRYLTAVVVWNVTKVTKQVSVSSNMKLCKFIAIIDHMYFGLLQIPLHIKLDAVLSTCKPMLPIQP